jgi:hypothetical protein
VNVEVLGQLSYRPVALDASATFALKAGLRFRRGRLFMVSSVRGDHRRFQAETPLIDLFKFAKPALDSSSRARGRPRHHFSFPRTMICYRSVRELR